ncbi:MAG: lipoate--protein ligase family protein [Spirochaetes bacterium]|nr:lipoate--protein ligase family protein [Spirochaetota bacterium]
MRMWRLIIHGECQPTWNMAVDGAIVRCSDTPTLRLYRWARPAITIGYFQDIEKEVNCAQCKKDDVQVIRRVTGGGAVFHHKEITYSFVHPLHGVFAKGTITDSYYLIAQPLIMALVSLGIDARYSAINDIIVGNKKISGSAQTRKEGKILQHGTLLVATDTERMFNYLTIDPKKVKHEGKPVVTLKDLLPDMSEEIIYQHLIQAIIDSFRKVFNIEFEESDLTHQEQYIAVELEKNYFANENWNCRRLSP